MDLDEWDLLSDEGFLDLHDDHRESNVSSKSVTNTTTVIDMNYFQKFSQPHKNLNSRVIPVPIQFDYAQEKTEEIPEKIETLKSDDHQDTVSQVFFKKLKENEFVDMKLDTPKSLNRGILPQIDVGTYQFEEKQKKVGNFEKGSEEMEQINKENREIITDDHDDGDDVNDEGLKVWKWAMTGIGALFSFGFAAVTVSLIVLGNRHRTVTNSKNQELHFQFYPHDKRLKQVVRRETRFNEAIAVMRGAPVNRAHVTIGGYFEGL